MLTISGSSRNGSHNVKLLRSLVYLRPEWNFEFFDISVLPLFGDQGSKIIYPENVSAFRSALSNSKALIISTPEYIHNIPAQLKNALEWITASGELRHKPVLPIVFTPYAPRGEKAMTSLLNSLVAMDASIPTNLLLHQQDTIWNSDGRIIGSEELLEYLNAALEFIN